MEVFALFVSFFFLNISAVKEILLLKAREGFPLMWY